MQLKKKTKKKKPVVVLSSLYCTLAQADAAALATLGRRHMSDPEGQDEPDDCLGDFL